MKSILFFIFLNLWSANGQSECVVLNNKGEIEEAQNDSLFLFLTSKKICPHNVIEFKLLLQKSGLQIEPAMVGNRGRHNFAGGSFSFFETVFSPSIPKGDFFFGHFSKKEGNTLLLDNENARGKLLIELIVWDQVKEVYNFYEMIGGQNFPQWFYRGDSLDILKDNKYIHRDPPLGDRKFGTTLRCAACHSSGGPIMKEMAAPHNDWWTKLRPLPFGENTKLSTEISDYVANLIDASTFSDNVMTGIKHLENSFKYQNFKLSLGLAEKLRPLFCENEINLQSDQVSFFEQSDSILIPSSYLISPFLGKISLQINKNNYLSLLKKYKVKFPETKLADADHAWLTPVKSTSDLMAIKTLKENGVVDEEFILDVLAIDFKNPTISKTRCDLLGLLPGIENEVWKSQFIKNLKTANSESAQELFNNLTDPNRDAKFHRKNAEFYLKELEQNFPLEDQFLSLFEVRNAIFNSDISKNPRGQILEPGFRVIFPQGL